MEYICVFMNCMTVMEKDKSEELNVEDLFCVDI